MSKILVVDDDKSLNKGLKYAINKAGYDVVSAFEYNEAVTSLDENDIMLAIIDINLPHKSGLDLCKYIRNKSTIPIIFLTAKDTENDIVKDLNLDVMIIFQNYFQYLCLFKELMQF